MFIIGFVFVSGANWLNKLTAFICEVQSLYQIYVLENIDKNKDFFKAFGLSSSRFKTNLILDIKFVGYSLTNLIKFVW